VGGGEKKPLAEEMGLPSAKVTEYLMAVDRLNKLERRGKELQDDLRKRAAQVSGFKTATPQFALACCLLH